MYYVSSNIAVLSSKNKTEFLSHIISSRNIVGYRKQTSSSGFMLAHYIVWTQSHRLQLSRNLRDSPGFVEFVSDNLLFVPEVVQHLSKL